MTSPNVETWSERRALSLGRLLWRSLFIPRTGLRHGETPLAFRTVQRVPPPDARLDEYRRVCGLHAEVPLTWPQVVATRTHIEMMTRPGFPFRVMGLVHPRCRLSVRRALPSPERLTPSSPGSERASSPATGFASSSSDLVPGPAAEQA